MLGLFGIFIIGIDYLMGFISDDEDKMVCFVCYDLVCGKFVFQDLGDDVGIKQLSFFFDEIFCDLQVELCKIDLVFKGCVFMKLFFDFVGFEVGVFLIEWLCIKCQKILLLGCVVCIELEVELVESVISFGGLLGVVVGIVCVISNLILWRG